MVSENYNCTLEPTPNYDCHVYKGSTLDTTAQIQPAHLFECTQVSTIQVVEASQGMNGILYTLKCACKAYIDFHLIIEMLCQ